MDNQLQTFIELSTLPELSELADDTRAAWVWSADGTRVLWANAAGAAFFSVRDVAGFARLTALARSPARPHIARIATSGDAGKMSIDRLRFYRGLRVMLLTCQCQRLVLPNGNDAALIICGDKGLFLTEPPFPAYLDMLAGTDRSVFVLGDSGDVIQQAGTLSGTPVQSNPEDGVSIAFAKARLNDALHDAAIAQLDPSRTLIVLKNEMLEEAGPQGVSPAEITAGTAVASAVANTGALIEAETSSASADALDAETPEPEVTGEPAAETDASGTDNAGDKWVRADELFDEEEETNAEPEITAEDDEDSTDAAEDAESAADTDSPSDDDVDPAETVAQSVEATVTADQDVADMPEDLGEATPELEAEAEAEAEEATPAEEPAQEKFGFSARRRPIRFAWKMDVDQRFTFLSDEFSDTLGPMSADIVGKTWAEVSEEFKFDEDRKIANALARRDTWSGKTILWPVTDVPFRVPVDMAALPAFDRDRVFEGYRGFGVCRTADAAEDPDGPHLLTAGPAVSISNEAADAGDEPVSDELELTEADVAAPDVADDDAEEPDTNATPESSEGPDTASVENVEQTSETSGVLLAASAAALVGSLSSGAVAATDEASENEGSGDESSKTDELPDTADAADEGVSTAGDDDTQPETDAETAGDGTSSSDADDSIPLDVTAASDELDVSEDVGAEDEDNTAPSPAADAAEDENTEASDDTTSDEDPEADEADLAARAEEQEQLSGEQVDENEDNPASTEPEETGEPELTGISGTAPLKPDEIESAVKTLAKSYGQKPPQDNGTDLPFDAQDTDEAREETVAADDGQPASVDEESDTEREEREFFDETAAYKEEETASPQLNLVTEKTPNNGETGHPATIPSDDDDGKVVRLAGRVPRLVPVDTSRLSKPEREAFRKIAEALGARLEGELEDGEAENEGQSDEAEAFAEQLTAPTIDLIEPGLLDRLPVGIAIARDRDVLYANGSLLNLLGYSNLNELSEAGGLEAVFAEDSEDNLPDADGMEGTVDGNLKVRLAGGGLRPVNARMHSVPWNGGRGLMISFAEPPAPPVSEIPAAELAKAHDLITEMDTILETATDGVLVLDSDGVITKVNRSTEALFSASRSDIEGAPLTEYLAPESHRAALDYLDGLARNGVASILNDGREVLGRVTGGGLIPLFMTMGRIDTSNGDHKFCAVLRDITQWKKAEEELTEAKSQAENANSQKSDFLAKISHEIRTPLNAIIGFSEVMMEERFGQIGNDRYKEYLKDIRTSGSHIMSLINDLLDLSKIEAGKMDLQFTAVSANDVVNECVALMQPQANRERVIIRASLPETVPSIVADPRSMRQIVLNLLSNAIKFNKSGGQVIVSTSLEDSGEVVLRVRDTGAGMSDKELAAALEPFRQVHTARHGGGTGLGLPLTKALIEANRASFHIDSTSGQGTLVEITFPPQRVLAE